MEHFTNDVEAVMRDPILFGDFRMALHEGETRIYEDIQDYEAAKALFQVWRGSLLRGHLSGELSTARVLRGWSWGEHLCVCLLVPNESLCLLQWFPLSEMHGDDLRNLLNTQTP